MDIPALKASRDFRSVVAATHPIGRDGKICCPFHDDAHPSCHIYPDGFKCFACGAHGDHITWLEEVGGLSVAAAIAYLSGGSGSVSLRRPPPRRAKAAPSYSPISAAAYGSYAHRLRVTNHLPKALEHRGLNLEQALQLGIAALGDDALLPIAGPSGDILALKRRFYTPVPKARDGSRYAYTTAGHGSPAWCSPDFSSFEHVLIIEGELNGIVSYSVLKEVGAALAVMGVAGVYGGLHEAALRGKHVYVWADRDGPGTRAKKRWQSQARRAGCVVAKALPATSADACELAAQEGRLYLASWLLEAMNKRPRTRTPKKELAWSA